MKRFIVSFGLQAILLGHFATPHAHAVNDVAGSLIVFNDNGAWSWFEDERVVVDDAYNKILLSSVASFGGPDGASRSGDVDVVSYDPRSRRSNRFTINEALQSDDHNSAALLILPDRRYLASYSKHGSEKQLRYRLSTNPGDISAWRPEKIFHTAGGTTYSNLYYLTAAKKAFNFHRDRGRGRDPNYLTWDVYEAPEFSYGGRLLTGPEGNAGNTDRPYLRYAGNGIDRIDFITTDGHPRDVQSNCVYHGYVQYESNGRLSVYQSDGRRIGDVSTTTTSPYEAREFTVLFAGNEISPANGLLMTRGWTTDIELDDRGQPCVIFTARVNDSEADHRFFYGRHTSTGWDIHELAKAGGFLYDREADYTGLAAIDPNSPGRVYVSTKIDPRNEKSMTQYEIFQGITADGGKSWTWNPITLNSKMDNLRPVVPKGRLRADVVLWLRGTYNSYTDYNLKVVGLTEISPIVLRPPSQ